MDEPGQEGLAGAGLTVEQHGDIVGGGQGHALDHGQERRRLGEQAPAQQLFQAFFTRGGELDAAADE